MCNLRMLFAPKPLTNHPVHAKLNTSFYANKHKAKSNAPKRKAPLQFGHGSSSHHTILVVGESGWRRTYRSTRIDLATPVRRKVGNVNAKGTQESLARIKPIVLQIIFYAHELAPSYESTTQILLLLVGVADAPPKGVSIASTDTSSTSSVPSYEREAATPLGVSRNAVEWALGCPRYFGSGQIVCSGTLFNGSHALLLFTAAFADTGTLRRIAQAPSFSIFKTLSLRVY